MRTVIARRAGELRPVAGLRFPAVPHPHPVSVPHPPAPGAPRPTAVRSLAFPSGSQSPARATANLAALRRLSPPWPVTFSFGWALAEPALAAWHGDPACIAAGQRALANRVACNVAALQGSYTAVLEPSYVLAGCA